jgi:hypothetical protein
MIPWVFMKHHYTDKTIHLYTLEHEGFFVVASPVGASNFAPWGYVIYRLNDVVGGAKNWNWTAADACNHALKALRAILEATDVPSSESIPLDQEEK